MATFFVVWYPASCELLCSLAGLLYKITVTFLFGAV